MPQDIKKMARQAEKVTPSGHTVPVSDRPEYKMYHRAANFQPAKPQVQIPSSVIMHKSY